MNWEALKQKTIPFVDKAKAAGIKALDFTQKQMQSTPITIKNEAEFETLKTEKRLIIITPGRMQQHWDFWGLIKHPSVWLISELLLQ